MKNKERIDFTGTDIYIGIDIHLKSWYVTIMHGNVSKQISFDSKAESIKAYLDKNFPNGTYKAVYEAGYFGYGAYEKLTQLGIETIVVNPSDIPTTDKEKVNKTDKSDSYKLALGLKSGYLTSIYIPNKQAQELRSLVRRREQLIQNQTRVKNRIKSLLRLNSIDFPNRFSKSGSHWSRAFITWLKEIEFKTRAGKLTLSSIVREIEFVRQELLEINRFIRDELSKEEIAENYRKLQNIPGIGKVGAAVLQTEIIDIKRFKTRDEFISYIGLCPTEQSSGESRKIGSLTRRCNRRVRTILIEASWIAISQDPSLGDFYNKNVVRIGKTKAIVKVSRKLASRIRHILLTNEEYETGIA